MAISVIALLQACSTSSSRATAPSITFTESQSKSPPIPLSPSPSEPATTALPVTDFTAATGALSASLPGDPTRLAMELIDIERGIRAQGVDITTVGSLGARQQLLFRRLGRDAQLWSEVRPLLPSDVIGPADLTMVAATAIATKASATTAPPSATLPAWTIAEPLPIDELLGYYREAQAATAVPWSLLAAVHLMETRMGRIVGVSSAGAVGPMQFLPSTWAECCTGDPTLARDAILGAATYLADSGAPEDLEAAVRRYNPNDTYVTAVLAYHTNMAADARAYLGYHGWQVFVGSAAGAIRLPVGYSATDPVDALAYAASHPEDLVG